MQLNGEIIAIKPGEFTGKKGRVETLTLTILDRCPVSPMTNTVDVQLTGEAREKCKFKVRDLVSFGVSEVRPGFGGRLRLEGQFLPVK